MFASSGFVLPSGRSFDACGVVYHAACVRVGAPFLSRLDPRNSLQLPWCGAQVPFVCELCTVQAHLGRPLRATTNDLSLLMLERMRMIDMYNGWSRDTLVKYKGKLQYLHNFDLTYGTQILSGTRLPYPPISPAIPLYWAESAYSLRTTRGRSGTMDRIRYASVRSIRSAASWFYTFCMTLSHPQQVMRDRFRRGMVMSYVSPTDAAITTFVHSGMARRLGTDVAKSWALAPVHIRFLDRQFEHLFSTSDQPTVRHDVTCAAVVNLLAYLGWLRGKELFDLTHGDITITSPEDGPSRGLPAGIGAIELRLQAATKSDPSRTADVVIAFETLAGFSPGKWLLRLLQFQPAVPGLLFSTLSCTRWSSGFFRTHFVYPLLNLQRRQGEPTLKAFSLLPGHRLSDKIYSIHSWRRAGRSKVSRRPRADEPWGPGARMATDAEVYEHGRWQRSEASEAMPRRYNQWDLSDRIGITLFCM